MRLILVRLFLSVLFVTPFAAKTFAHTTEPSRVKLIAKSAVSVDAGKFTFKFELFDSVSQVSLTDADLNIEMEKKLHFIVYDQALQEFQHIHPTYANGEWSVEMTLLKNGEYWLWAQGQLADHAIDFSASGGLTIQNGVTANSLPPVLGDQRTGTDGLSQVTMAPGVIRHGTLNMLILNFARTDGSTPELSPYLGAPAHVTAVSEDGDSMIHVHPMTTQDPNQLMLHAVFGDAGDYRIWLQFNDGGVLKLVPLSVTVQ